MQHIKLQESIDQKVIKVIAELDSKLNVFDLVAEFENGTKTNLHTNLSFINFNQPYSVVLHYENLIKKNHD